MTENYKKLYEDEKEAHEATKAALRKLKEAFRRHFFGLLAIALLLVPADDITERVVEYSEKNVTH